MNQSEINKKVGESLFDTARVLASVSARMDRAEQRAEERHREIMKDSKQITVRLERLNGGR